MGRTDDQSRRTAAAEAEQLRAEYLRGIRLQMNQNVGSNIGAARRARKMGQEELATAVNVDLPGWKAKNVSLVERGQRELSPLELLAFAAALEVPAGQLLLPPEGRELPMYSGVDWDAARVKEIVLGRKPAMINAAGIVVGGELTPEQLRDQLKRKEGDQS